MKLKLIKILTTCMSFLKSVVALAFKGKGFVGIIYNAIATLLLEQVLKLLQKWKNKEQVEKDVNEKLDEYKEVINKPNPKPDDVANSGNDLLNS